MICNWNQNAKYASKYAKNVQNMQAMCRFWWYCPILHAIFKICKKICTICKICKRHFQYAEYAPPTLLMSNRDISKPGYYYDTIVTFGINYVHYDTIMTLLFHLSLLQKSDYCYTLWQNPGQPVPKAYPSRKCFVKCKMKCSHLKLTQRML